MGACRGGLLGKTLGYPFLERVGGASSKKWRGYRIPQSPKEEGNGRMIHRPN